MSVDRNRSVVDPSGPQQDPRVLAWVLALLTVIVGLAVLVTTGDQQLAIEATVAAAAIAANLRPSDDE